MIESFESAAVAASIGRLYRARAPDPKDTSVFRWLVPRAAVIVNVCTRGGGSIKEEWMRYTMREMPRPCCGLSLHRNGCQFGLLTKLCPTLISYKEYFFESATNGALISEEKKFSRTWSYVLMAFFAQIFCNIPPNQTPLANSTD